MQKRVLVLCPLVPGRREILGTIKSGQLAGADHFHGIEFDFRLCRLSAPVWDNHLDFAVSDLATIEAGLNAENEGYDAVCIETITDGGLDALRSALSIPVLSAGQASYLTAMQLGRKFSIIVVWKGFRLAHERTLRMHGLEAHCASIRDLGMNPADVNFADMFGNREREYFDSIANVAKQAAETDGADTVILGSTTMYKARDYVSKHLPFPVIEPAVALYKMTESVLSLGLTHSHAAYPKATAPKAGVVQAMVSAVDESDKSD
jgi:allantoin racemase